MTQHACLAEELRHRRIPSKFVESVLRCEEAVAKRPASAVAEHNLAAALGDAGLWTAAERHIRAAFAKGGDAPETWLVFARALVESGKWTEAEHAYQQSLARRPLYQDALRELAQLRWMSSGDVSAALEIIDVELQRVPHDASLKFMRAHVLENAGFRKQAHTALVDLLHTIPDNPSVLTALAQISLELGDYAESLRLSSRAIDLAPQAPVAAVAFANACCALGAPERALPVIEKLHKQQPENQHAIALLATVWRLMGNPRYHELYNFDAFVGSYSLGVPPGWSNLAAYMSDLAVALDLAHHSQAHPFNQSIKNGTQAAHIFDLGHPALHALPVALDTPITAFLQRLGAGNDLFRARNNGGFAIKGIWSIRMRAGGVHINHVHSEGWISSACYISVPQAPSGREGWLKFGEPGTATRPPCPPEHFVEPQVGRIAFFPSYMWHGTIPFSGEGVRMTFALDIVPD